MSTDRRTGFVTVLCILFGIQAGILNSEEIDASGGSNPLTEEEQREGFVAIFDGETLDGWEVMGQNKEAFYVKDGSIECNGRGGEWIRYRTPLSDFVLRLEYRISQHGNSGIFLRAKTFNPPYTGFEIQVIDSYGSDPNRHSAGAIYDVYTPMVNMARPHEEWNEVEITCCGPYVTVAMNGILIVDADFDQLTEPRGKFSTPYAELPRTGFIGFQDHGNAVWYRNIRLKNLGAISGDTEPPGE